MPKIAFMGAGSTIFAKNVLGDCILTPTIRDLEISLHDIDPVRLEDSRAMLASIAKNAGVRVPIEAHLDRKAALMGANYVVNAIQVGGYEPSTVIDFEVPKKYGLRQTIADTLGIGGIFRTLRTIPVLEGFAEDIEALCPNALFLNYTNPMAMLSGYLQRFTNVKTIGLCHSVQGCVRVLLEELGMDDIDPKSTRWEVAGINHQAWLLKVEDQAGADLYPEIKRRAKAILDGAPAPSERADVDRVRFEMMMRFGYYMPESSEHASEYVPWFIKSRYPELIDRYKIPLDEYPRRCVKQINSWAAMREELLGNAALSHTKSHEYAASIIDAVENDIPFRVHGNVLNRGIITNLPSNACVEVPCMIDRNGVNPCFVGDLPEQCAAINRMSINVQNLTLQAARSRRREDVYMAAMLDPHTAAELSIDDIVAMCDDLFEAHGDMMPKYR